MFYRIITIFTKICFFSFSFTIHLDEMMWCSVFDCCSNDFSDQKDKRYLYFKIWLYTLQFFKSLFSHIFLFYCFSSITNDKIYRLIIVFGWCVNVFVFSDSTVRLSKLRKVICKTVVLVRSKKKEQLRVLNWMEFFCIYMKQLWRKMGSD